MTTATAVKWSEKTQERLTNIEAAIENEQARVQEYTRERDAGSEELRVLGALNLKGLEKKMVDAGVPAKIVSILLARSGYVVTLFALKHARAHVIRLNEKLRETIRGANQGTLFDADDIESREPSEAELFTKREEPEEDEDPDPQALPIGEVRGGKSIAANSESRAIEDGYVGDGPKPADFAADVDTLGIPDRIVRHLRKAQLNTIGQLENFWNDAGMSLAGIDGMKQTEIDEVVAALRKWQAVQRIEVARNKRKK